MENNKVEGGHITVFILVSLNSTELTLVLH